MPTKCFKFDFFYNIKRMIALFCATFYDPMNDFISVYGFIIVKILAQSSYRFINNIALVFCFHLEMKPLFFYFFHANNEIGVDLPLDAGKDADMNTNAMHILLIIFIFAHKFWI